MQVGFKARLPGPRASSPPFAGETPAVPRGAWLLHQLGHSQAVGPAALASATSLRRPVFTS